MSYQRSVRRSTRREHSEEDNQHAPRSLRSKRRSTRLSPPRYAEQEYFAEAFAEVDDEVLEPVRKRKKAREPDPEVEVDDDETPTKRRRPVRASRAKSAQANSLLGEEKDGDDQEDQEYHGDSDPEDEPAELEDVEDVEDVEEDEDEDEEDEDEGGDNNKNDKIEHPADDKKQKKRGRGRPPGRRSAILPSMTALYDGVGAITNHRFINHEDDLREDDSNIRTENGNRRLTKVKKVHNNPFPVPVDDNGDFIPLTENEDEYVTLEDEKGNTKIDEYGRLKGDRDFRVRTFTVTGKGETLYMLSTEPARCLGYRDAYYLFLKHPSLYKFILSMHEKQDLVERKILPNSYKSRTIGLVTARSVFKEFGPKILIGGRKVVDEYYEDAARENGDIEGELAVPEDPVPSNKNEYNKKRYIAWYGGSQIYQQSLAQQLQSSPNATSPSGAVIPNSVQKFKGFPMTRPFKLKSNQTSNMIDEENWLLEHSQSSSNYDQELLRKRVEVLQKARGKRDLFTGIYFQPISTQSTRSIWQKQISPQQTKLTNFGTVNHSDWGGFNGDITNHADGLVYETVVQATPGIKITGLKNVDVKVFEDCVSSDIKEAILNQRMLEKCIT